MDTQKLKDVLNKDGSFAIVVGQGYGLDEMGAALSLYLTLKSSGKDISIVSTKQPLVEVSNLVGIDKVRPTYESKGGDLVVSFPYQQDEIGKVSYTLESGFLNIIVKPKDAALSFGEKDVVFKRNGDLPTVLITVGVKRLSELGALFSIEALKDTTIINIDKAANNEGYGDIVMVSQGASSVSEQVTSMLVTLAFPMDADVAQNLMSGVISATGNFQSPRTSSLAFEMAGVLLRNGARREAIRPINAPQPQNIQNNQQSPRPVQNPVRVAQNPQNVQNQPQQVNQFPREQKKDDAPPDWLSPKIFKGSTNVE